MASSYPEHHYYQIGVEQSRSSIATTAQYPDFWVQGNICGGLIDAYPSPESLLSTPWASPASSSVDIFGGAPTMDYSQLNKLSPSYSQPQLVEQNIYRSPHSGLTPEQVADDVLLSLMDIRHSTSIACQEPPHAHNREWDASFEGYGNAAPVSWSAPGYATLPQSSRAPYPGNVHSEWRPLLSTSPPRAPHTTVATKPRGRNRTFSEEEVALADALVGRQIAAAKRERRTLQNINVYCPLCEGTMKAKSRTRHFKSHRAGWESICCGLPRPGGGEGKGARIHACWKVFSRKDALQRHMHGEAKKIRGCRGSFEEMRKFWQAHGEEIELE